MASLRQTLVAHPVLWLLAFGIPVFLVNFFAGRPGISGWDANYYYAYAAALAETGTLELERPYRELAARGADPVQFDPNRRTAAGRVFNYFPIGHPLLHAPAAAFGTALARLWEDSPGACGPTAQLLYSLSCIAAAAAGLGLMARALRQWFDAEAAAVAIWVMCACSMLGYYWFVLPALSHTSSLLMGGAILALTARLAEGPQRSAALWGALGLAIGYNTAVRLQDAGFALAMAPLAWRLWADALPGREKIARLTALAFGVAVGFAPQLLHWRWQSGAWLVMDYQENSYFDWARPNLLPVLFSFRHGLFSWHPALGVAAAAFFGLLVAKTAPAFRRTLLLVWALAFLAVWYVGASYSIWWFGASFGSRPFLSVTPLFLIGFAWIWTRVRERRGWRLAFWAGAGVLAAWNALLALAFHLSWISRTEAPDIGVLSDRLVKWL